MQMNTTGGSFDNNKQVGTHGAAPDALDTLLAHASRYTPSEGFAERVLAALHEEEKAAAPLPRPWYLRPYTWRSSAAAACLAATLCLLPLLNTTPAMADESLVVDDTLLIEEALDAIDDPNLVSAICSVAAGY